MKLKFRALTELRKELFRKYSDIKNSMAIGHSWKKLLNIMYGITRSKWTSGLNVQRFGITDKI